MVKSLLDLLLGDILPSSIHGDPGIDAIAQALDPQLLGVSHDIREALIYSRIDDLPEPVIDLLAWQWHADFYEPMSLAPESKRRIVKSLLMVHRLKGTRWAIEEGLRTIGVEARVIPWFEMDPEGAPYTFTLDGWLMDSFRSAGSDALDKETMRLVRQMIEETKSARDYLAGISLGIGLEERVDANDGDGGSGGSFDFDIWREIPLVEFYPWSLQLHDGSAHRAGRVHRDGSIVRDGLSRHASRRAGGVLRNAHIDELGLLDIALAGFEERITTTVYRGCGVRRDGAARHGPSDSPIDGGGAITVRSGALRNGTIRRDGGTRLTRDGSIRRGRTHTHYAGGNRHVWRERTLSF